MPCACANCLQHASTLGLADKQASKAAIRKAFRAQAKLWHPDKFENDEPKRLEAEEHFKQIQVAYRELWDHHEHPRQLPAEEAFPSRTPPDNSPRISFGGAPGCFVAPDFSRLADRIIARHLAHPENAMAIVDLSGSSSKAGTFDQFMLFTRDAILVRNAQKIISLLWYYDLGEVTLVDQRKEGKLGFWQRVSERISGIEQKYALQIDRRDKSHFYTIVGQVDDSVKKVIYIFLLQMRSHVRF
ncbi:MAG: J domain-containing protein [Terracidiphilus sp.]